MLSKIVQTVPTQHVSLYINPVCARAATFGAPIQAPRTGRKALDHLKKASGPWGRRCLDLKALKADQVGDDQDRCLLVLSDALIVASHACQSESILAAKCLVETIIEGYRQGFTAEKFKVSVALRGFELGNDVMSDQAENVLNSWVSLVMLTLWQLGLTPRGTESTAAGKREDPKFSRDALGMLGFVKQTIAMVEGGMNLVKVQELQAETQPSQSVKLMQQNTLLIVLAMEILDRQGLLGSESAEQGASISTSTNPTTSPESPWANPSCYYPTGYLNSVLVARDVKEPTVLGQNIDDFERDWGKIDRPRALAVQLLLSFKGSVLGAEICTNCFVDCGMVVYSSGFAAHEVLSQLHPHELEPRGGLHPIFEQSQERTRDITKRFFAWWLSVVYMTLALLGAPRVAGPATDGWGWAGAQDEDSGSIEASSISNLVSYTLSRLQGQASGEETEDLTLAGRLKGNPEALEKLNAYRQEVLSEQAAMDVSMLAIKDDSLRETSSTALVMDQMMTLVELSWKKYCAQEERKSNARSPT